MEVKFKKIEIFIMRGEQPPLILLSTLIYFKTFCITQ